MLYRPVPSKLNQIAFGFSIKKSGANHFSIRICAALPRKGIFGYSQSRGIPRSTYEKKGYKPDFDKLPLDDEYKAAREKLRNANRP